MFAGMLKFVLAIVVFMVVGFTLNPILGAVFNGFRLSTIGVLACQFAAAGLVIAKK